MAHYVADGLVFESRCFGLGTQREKVRRPRVASADHPKAQGYWYC